MSFGRFLRRFAGEAIAALLLIALSASCGERVNNVAAQPAEAPENTAYTVLKEDGPYYDEVTDPNFQGYQEIDHSQGETLEPCPVTPEEIVMLAQTMYQEAQVVYWDGTKWGVSYQARQAAVGWCALNRYDAGSFGSTLTEVLNQPHQFDWKADAPVTDEMLYLAEDIVTRWWMEKQGAQDVGRTLPADYLFFEGDGKENHFRKEYEHTGETWDWSLPDPYKEDAE